MVNDLQRFTGKWLQQNIANPLNAGYEHIRKPLNKLMPQQLGDSLISGAHLLNEFSPGADVRDIKQGGQKLFSDPMGGMTDIALGSVGMFPGVGDLAKGAALAGMGAVKGNMPLDVWRKANAKEFETILSPDSVDIGRRVGKNQKLWRGENETAGHNGATYGSGKYTTTSKADAKGYAGDNGQLLQMDMWDDAPSNPLRFDTIMEYENWLDRSRKEIGYKGPRDFNKDFPDHEDFIASLGEGIDGIQIGKGNDALFVKYSDDQLADIYKPSSTKDPWSTQSTMKRTDTPEFKNWFGDSKVVDDAGAPLTVYHGSSTNINNFDGGTFFTKDADAASGYAIDRGRDGGANVLPVNLSLKNPATNDIIEKIADDFGWYDTENLHEFLSPNIRPAETKKMIAALKSKGYDGAKITGDYDLNGGEIESYVAFNPEQIKSIHNKGKYSPTSKNIVKSAAPIGLGAIVASKALQHNTDKQDPWSIPRSN